MRLIFIIATLLPVLGYGQQNIVPNSGFEEHTACPYNSAEIEFAYPWTNTGHEFDSPDYFNACSLPLFFPPDLYIPNLGIPENAMGYQNAYSGDGYAGFYTYQGPYPNSHEFIQVELVQPIQAGIRYEVSFHVSLADKFGMAVGSLGAFFSPELLVRESMELPQVEPQVQSPSGLIFNDKVGWTEVRDTFNSRVGGEHFIIIGNFLPDSLSNVTFVDSGATNTYGIRSYYYIDDVSVIALDSIPSSVKEQSELHFSVSPNPATDMIRIKTPQLLRRVRLLDVLGREVYSEDVVGNAHTIHLSGIPSGLYLIEAHDNEGRRAVERVVKTAQQ